jgi:hypothetical protein
MTRRLKMELVNAVSQITQVPKKEKVAIIGCADSKEEAPWHLTEEFEFWGVNNLFLTFPKPFTRWFDIHQFSQAGETWLRRGKPDFRGMPINKYLAALGKLPFPIYMQQPNPLVPNAIVFPFAAMVQAFGGYYTNTISWEISLAMAEGFKEIHIYGVDMAVDSEYHHQRPSCEYFLGMAVGRGIKVFIPDTCDLMKTRFLYGAQEPIELPFRNKISAMQKSMHERRAKSEQEMQLAQRKMFEYNGALAATAEIDKIYKNVTGG